MTVFPFAEHYFNVRFLAFYLRGLQNDLFCGLQTLSRHRSRRNAKREKEIIDFIRSPASPRRDDRTMFPQISIKLRSSFNICVCVLRRGEQVRVASSKINCSGCDRRLCVPEKRICFCGLLSRSALHRSQCVCVFASERLLNNCSHRI